MDCKERHDGTSMRNGQKTQREPVSLRSRLLKSSTSPSVFSHFSCRACTSRKSLQVASGPAMSIFPQVRHNFTWQATNTLTTIATILLNKFDYKLFHLCDLCDLSKLFFWSTSRKADKKSAVLLMSLQANSRAVSRSIGELWASVSDMQCM